MPRPSTPIPDLKEKVIRDCGCAHVAGDLRLVRVRTVMNLWPLTPYRSQAVKRLEVMGCPLVRVGSVHMVPLRWMQLMVEPVMDAMNRMRGEEVRSESRAACSCAQGMTDFHAIRVRSAIQLWDMASDHAYAIKRLSSMGCPILDREGKVPMVPVRWMQGVMAPALETVRRLKEEREVANG